MSGPLFSGTVHFVHPTFVTPGGTFTFAAADMQAMVTYAQHAIVPILEMVQQEYGPSTVEISSTTLDFTMNMAGSTFSGSDVKAWVNAILSANSLDAATSMIVIPCPTGISDDSGFVVANGGYHDLANGPFATFGVYATGLTLADQVDQYAMVVSHEIAEAIVDPKVDHVNPEVGDPCCENCYHASNFYRAYFDAFNTYLGTNQTSPPGGFAFAYYAAVVVKPAGGGDCPAPDEDCNYLPTPQAFYFVLDKNNYGRDEVTDTPTWSPAFYVFLEGYSPNSVASSTPTFSGTFDSTHIPGLSITPAGISYDLGNTGDDANVPQRIRFAYRVSFTAASLSAFPTPGNQPLPFQLGASINVQGNALPFTPRAEFFLLAGSDPYFTNIRSGAEYFYLSQDLRVFTGTPAVTSQPVAGPGAPTLTDSVGGAYQYIQDLVGYLNQQFGYLNASFTPPDTNVSDPLDTLLPDQDGALDGDSTVTPKSGSSNNYNFAIARVRLKGSSGSAGAAANVKVFFRLFTTQTFDTDFIDNAGAVSSADPNVTYPSTGGSTPSSPLPGTDGGGTINGCSLPFFATANFGASPTDYAAGGVNNQTIEIPTGDYTWAFFGCFLNVYDPGNTIGGQSVQYWTAGSAHNCLVAQLAYDEAPIVNSNGVIENPENCDKLAQRNLQVTPSGNPGYPLTHRVPQTLDVRPSQSPPVADKKSLLSYPDEIMVDWGRTPLGTVADLFWPAVNAADVLGLAAGLYASHALDAVGANTLRCRVVSKVTYIPIPVGTGGSFAGLFTLQLPASVRVGSEYQIVVRRLTTKRVPKTPVLQRDAESVGKEFIWRYVTGTFSMKIPVQKESAILPVDENLLAILKWRLGIIEPANRWHPVLVRYIEVISQRIQGMGGDPTKILPSPHGYHPGHLGPTHGGAERCTIGKIADLFFDRFGDFKGFTLRTEDGKEYAFSALEHEIEQLIYRGWRERFVIKVCEDARDRRVVSVTLLRAPRPLGQ